MWKRRWASRCASLIDKHCGGVRGGWDNLLAVIPGRFFRALRSGAHVQ